MRKAILLTTFNRPHYLEEVLRSWQTVRGVADWHFHVLVEPSPQQDEILALLERYQLDWESIHIEVNPQVYGVLHNPWVGFERLFREERFDFVVRIEDDLVVSDDILEYFSHHAERWQSHDLVYAVLGFTPEDGSQESFRSIDRFNPWVWGTWSRHWFKRIGPTWDHDYSTYNGFPGNQSGWDWNLDTRIFPSDGVHSIIPTASRVQNIGKFGVHAVGDVEIGGGFVKDRQPVEYVEAEGNSYD